MTTTIQDHRSLFRQFLAGAYDAIIITDPNGHILQINPRAQEYFGYTIDELEDKPVSVLVAGVSSAIVQRIRKGLDESRHMMLDSTCIAKDGGKFAAEVTLSVVDLVNPGDLVFTVRNTERRSGMIRALRGKENAFDLTHTALFVCGRNGAFEQLNQAFLDMFSLTGEEAMKLSFADVFDDAPLQELFKGALAGSKGNIRLAVENDDGVDTFDIVLGPNTLSRKICGVVGSVVRV